MKASIPGIGMVGMIGLSAFLASAWSVPPAAFAESKTEIEQKDGKYKETYQNDDGTKSEYQVDKKDGTHVYKDSNGVSVKEKVEDGKLKQEYKDGNCEQATQKDLATGDSKVVAKGDCTK